MTEATQLDQVLFVAFPYLAIALLVIVSVQRYRSNPFTVSSLSSQFLESRKHFWALVPFHYGMIWILTGHLLALFIPAGTRLWNGDPLRLWALEISGMAAAMLAFVGLAAIMVRRSDTERIRVVTSRYDWLLYVVLMFQVVTGFLIAVLYPWGSTWAVSTAVPYLWSLGAFQPDLSYILNLPWLVKAHIVNAFVFIAIFPFTRMMHVLVAPFPYLWRRPQVARWHR